MSKEFNRSLYFVYIKEELVLAMWHANLRTLNPVNFGMMHEGQTYKSAHFYSNT